MQPVRTFTVIPALPPALARLQELADNLRWSWSHATIDLFRRLDPDLWERSGHNPVLMLGTVDQERLEAAASDEAYLAHYRRVCEVLDQYLKAGPTWYETTHLRDRLRIAYFSAEFGLTECLPIYSGGLGILAGDHLKASSELGVPIVGVGLLYQQGYFRQYLNADGWQQEAYVDNDFFTLPVAPVRGADGAPVTVAVAYPGRQVTAQVWRAQVGRVPLYLLDTNIPANRADDRDITDQLYGGDLEMRMKQEILLGIGGLRALAAVEQRPTVCHMNEGHPAFAALERIRLLMAESGLSFHEAVEVASAAHVFTTHTPVPAGHDYFPPDLMDKYFGNYHPALGLSRREFLALGRQNEADERESFCMTILAMRLSAHRNAVSRLHGRVTRKMWHGLWPEVPEDEVPIGAITNGVHFRSWISHDLDQLFDLYLGRIWRATPADEAVWRKVEDIPAQELWRVHEHRRERLVFFARRHLQAQLSRRGAPATEVAQAEEALDSGALTLGFTRRFATYKRATLLLRDPERLAAIVNHPARPVQIIFAGKAHPRDEAGKALIRQIVRLSREERFRRRIVFLEDYDMAVARYLVQGADVWLNTPLRPQEASGTSGMKAAANGALNVSILDGWWDEAYAPAVGWAIGKGEAYQDRDAQDEIESRVLYDLLEREVVPLFYDRGQDGLPREWIARMKAALRTLSPIFNANRLVRDYVEQCYLPSFEHWQQMSAEEMARARVLAAWKARVRDRWPAVRVEAVDGTGTGELRIGAALEARARVTLGSLVPEDVTVQLYCGRLDPSGAIAAATVVPMKPVKREDDGRWVFAGETAVRATGRHGVTVRVLPHHPDLMTPIDMGLIEWAQ